MRNRLLFFFERSGEFSVEIENSFASILVGLWFILYPDVYTQTETFFFFKFLPAFVYGIIYASFGISHLLALFTGLKRIRKEIIAIKSGLWAFLAFMILAGNPFSILGYLAVLFMTMTSLTFVRIQIFKRSI